MKTILSKLKTNEQFVLKITAIAMGPIITPKYVRAFINPVRVKQPEKIDEENPEGQEKSDDFDFTIDMPSSSSED